MPYQYIGSRDLIWQPEMSIKTFASGLILATRTAVIRREFVGNARQELEVGSPLPIIGSSQEVVATNVETGQSLVVPSGSVEGIRIFPEPEESESNGFITFTVTGYGRKSTSVFGNKQNKSNYLYVDVNSNIASKELKSLLFVVLATDTVIPADYITNSELETKKTSETPQRIVTTYSTIKFGPAVFERVNYGYFDEVLISEGVIAQDDTKETEEKP
jgi:hypothetical protein